MSDRAFLDTNVLVYAFDADSPVKQAIARRLLEELALRGRCVLSTQVLQELFVTVTRKRAVAPPEAARSGTTRRAARSARPHGYRGSPGLGSGATDAECAVCGSASFTQPWVRRTSVRSRPSSGAGSAPTSNASWISSPGRTMATS